MSGEPVDAASTRVLDPTLVNNISHTLTISITWPSDVLSSNGRPASYLLDNHFSPPAPTGTAPVDTSISLTLTFLAVSDVGLLMFSIDRALVEPFVGKRKKNCSQLLPTKRPMLRERGPQYSPNNPPRVQHARKPTENCEEDIDQEVGTATTLEKDSELADEISAARKRTEGSMRF